MEVAGTILQSLGMVAVSVGSVVGFAYWLFKRFSDKWLTAKFAERLQDYKHAQQKELENVRFEINKLMDRTIKLHQREYDALPETWSLLVEAHGIAKAVLSPLQEYADVGRMNERQLDEFLANSSFKKWQIDELKASDDKNRYYHRLLDWQKTAKAREALRQFHIYRLKHGIFMLPAIHQSLQQMDDLIFSAIIERESELHGDLDRRERKARQELEANGETIMEGLATSIRERLWS